MKVPCATMVAAFLAAGTAAACEQAIPAKGEGNVEAQSFISRGWTWPDGTGKVTFTASGPPEQVNSLDPANGIVECPDCQLASSVQFGPEDEATYVGVAAWDDGRSD